jgi:amphiphysin
MAESKGSLLAKSVQKHAGRAKEKLLQNLGKVDRTEDDIFDEHLTNYSRQQTSALRLQKEFGNYIRAIRTVQTVSKQLMDAISEVYETQWTGSEAVQAQIQAIEVLYQDYQHKLADQVLLPLNTYAAQFPEMRKKIDKRNRKLIDYDGQRHSFQNIQAAAAKKKDDIKITKGREQLDEARRTYELLNSELHDELPALYDSRILFLVTNLQTLFASEQVFHNETAKIYSELESVVDKLATESQRGSYTFKKITPTINSNPSSPPTSPVKTINSVISSTVVTNNNNNSYPNVVANGNGTASNPESPTSQSPSSPSPIDQNFEKVNIPTTQSVNISNNNNNNIDDKPSSDIEPTYQNTESILNNESHVNNIDNENEMDTNLSNTSIVINNNNHNNNNNINVDDDNNDNKINSTSSSPQPVQQQSLPVTEELITATTSTSPLLLQLSKENVENLNGNLKSESNKNSGNINNNNNNRLEQLYDIPVGATTTDLPPGVLYRVKATYRYIKEDVDELSFEVGDIIRVIEYDDPDDQEEGWLMGYKENSTDKGLFPANFTRPL